jgi:hypothetical protein
MEIKKVCAIADECNINNHGSSKHLHTGRTMKSAVAAAAAAAHDVYNDEPIGIAHSIMCIYTRDEPRERVSDRHPLSTPPLFGNIIRFFDTSSYISHLNILQKSNLNCI